MGFATRWLCITPEVGKNENIKNFNCNYYLCQSLRAMIKAHSWYASVIHTPGTHLL